MSNLLIAETHTTPRISFDAEANSWSLSGRSYHEYPTHVYASLLKWVSDYEKQPCSYFSIKFKFEFINTQSLKIVCEVLMRIKRTFDPSKSAMKIEWYHDRDDEDIKDTGESLRAITFLPIEIIAY